MNLPFLPDNWIMESNENSFVLLSRKLKENGDFDHAERLLKSGLKKVQSNLQNDELQLLEILKELATIYEAQGKLDEHSLLMERIDDFLDRDIMRRPDEKDDAKSS